MNIAICDDETVFIKDIKQKILNISEKQRLKVSIDTYLSGNDLIQSQSKYNVVFLDIEMPEIDGLTLASTYKKGNDNCLIIFITSHIEFSCQGYKVNAFRFLPKINNEAEIEEALVSVEKLNEGRRKILLKTVGGGQAILEYDDILFVETEGRKIKVHCKNDGFIANDSISSIENRLASPNFYLVHRSFLVNLNYIVRCEKREVYMTNGKEVPVSEKKHKAFVSFYLNWKFERGNG